MIRRTAHDSFFDQALRAHSIPVKPAYGKDELINKIQRALSILEQSLEAKIATPQSTNAEYHLRVELLPHLHTLKVEAKARKNLTKALVRRGSTSTSPEASASDDAAWRALKTLHTRCKRKLTKYQRCFCKVGDGFTLSA